MSITELLQAVNQLNEPDLDHLLDQVLLLRAKRKNNILSAAETELLLQINQGVPADLHQQYQRRNEMRAIWSMASMKSY
jgi:hypothetical protein